MSGFRAACVQFSATDDAAQNLRTVSGLIREAAGQGAQFVATPENTNLMAPEGAKLQKTFPQDADPSLPAHCALAGELGIWLLLGSLAIKVSETKTANRSFLINPHGKLAAQYDKIHLFDVDLPGEHYRESASVAGGNQAVTAELPWGTLGMTVCYDLRFPRLYRDLAQAGAFFFTIPAAFTATTGKAHWHVLTRARAIENGAFVIAPAQCGTHAGGRKTFGHSLMISPWGEILAEAGSDPGVILAAIDPRAAAEVRAAIPSLSHDRAYTLSRE